MLSQVKPEPISSQPNPTADTVLGLDIGVSSIGWALIDRPWCETGGRILACGSHLFDPGTDGADADRARGNEQPKNAARRTARLTRRQTWRRARRKRKLITLLVSHGLLPPTQSRLRSPQDIHDYLSALDRTLRPNWAHSHEDQQRWPYLIRAAAVVRPLPAFEVGRALVHLAQRRGFLSNRRADAGQSDDERSSMKKAIGDLAQHIAAHEPPTLGAYLASLDPDQERLRGRWTSRAMYEEEFSSIKTAQAGALHIPDAAWEEIHEAIFHQRPLKSQKHLIGRCSLIPSERRAPLACRLYQRFRVLQTVNNLRLDDATGVPRFLTQEERAALIDTLCREGDLSWAKAKKTIGMKRGAEFGAEKEGESKLIGHRTDAKLRAVLGNRFDGFTEVERDAMVDDLRSFRLPDALERRGQRRWGLDSESAKAFADIGLEEGYGSLSIAAIERLMPAMERGVPYSTVRKDEFPESFASSTPHDLLPPVLDAVEDLRNPGVVRSLTEIRKVVNEIVRRFGKPGRIHVELARDLKNPPKVRERINRQNRERERERAAIKERIIKEMGYQNPSRADIEKVLLADECGWRCPYTGRQIEMSSLLGRAPQFDIEHIWPRSRSLDDSFVNKTLCYHEENRNRKRGRTPFEAYHGSGEAWDDMLARVRAFKGDHRTRTEKLRRFMAESIDSDFTNRHLADTRYIGSVAADYLGILYGGRKDAEGQMRVFVRSGGLTAWLRSGWGLADILGTDEDGSKSRDDHRHHAVDAIVIAMTDERAVQTLSRAAARADELGKRRAFESVDEPWNGFREAVMAMVDQIVVSCRSGRRVSGALHEATLYSKPKQGSRRVSKELDKLTANEIKAGKIVDKRALRAIEAKLSELGLTNPTDQQIKKVFEQPANAPMVKGHNGKPVRLRKVKVEVSAKPTRIGTGASERFVKTGSNHHTVVWEVLDAKGQVVRWEQEPVSLLEAYRRMGAKEPVVRRDGGPNRRFVFSLVKGEHIVMNDPKNPDRREVYRLLSISEGDIEVLPTHDARPSTERRKERVRITGTGDRFRTLKAEKVRVTHLGEIRPARD